jgi:hypothetical protein
LVRFPQPETWLGFYQYKNKRTMENQEEKETSIEYFYERVLESINYSSDEYYAITEALNEAKKMYEEEIKKAFKKGCLKGYRDHVKLTNTLYK